MLPGEVGGLVDAGTEIYMALLLKPEPSRDTR
jgi:hypothetical protein